MSKNSNNAYMPPARVLQAQVDRVRVDSACLRIASREEPNPDAAQALVAAALKLTRTANVLERMSHDCEGKGFNQK